MHVKKAGGRVYGADLTAAERRGMNLEIERQLAEHTRKHAVELEAMVLWVLHEQFGFGISRMQQFSENFEPLMVELITRYDMPDTDRAWLCTQKLKEYGVDLDRLYVDKGLV